MRESIYLFKQGFRPVWEDRRNINGGSWTFRMSKSIGPDFWTHIQLLAIGEKLQEALDEGKCTHTHTHTHDSYPLTQDTRVHPLLKVFTATRYGPTC